jgi:hypothetical protein
LLQELNKNKSLKKNPFGALRLFLQKNKRNAPKGNIPKSLKINSLRHTKNLFAMWSDHK